MCVSHLAVKNSHEAGSARGFIGVLLDIKISHAWARYWRISSGGGSLSGILPACPLYYRKDPC